MLMTGASVKAKAVFAVAALLIMLACFGVGCANEPAIKPVLGDFPNLFLNDTLIVVGSNTTTSELEQADSIAKFLKKFSGNESLIKTDGNVSSNDKANHNLILIGVPNSNTLLDGACNKTNATRITADYPGVSKGILQILANPWKDSRPLLIVAGSNATWVEKASIMLEERVTQSRDYRNESILLIDQALFDKEYSANHVGLNLSEFTQLDTLATEIFHEEYPFTQNWSSITILYQEMRSLENETAPKVIRAEGRWVLPPPNIIFSYQNNNFSVIEIGVDY